MATLQLFTILLVIQPIFPNVDFHLITRDVIKLLDQTNWVSLFSCQESDYLSLSKLVILLMDNGYKVNIISNLAKAPLICPGIFVLNLKCKNSEIILTKANEAGLFGFPYKWLIFQESEDVKYFTKLNILVDSDVTLVTKYSLVKIFKRHISDQTIIRENFGFYTNKITFVENFEKFSAKRRKNLNGTILNTCIVITNNDTLNHLTDKRDQHIDSITKVNYVLVEHLSNIVNAKLNYSMKTTWGYKNNQSKWSGMIGKLTRKEADIGGTALFLTADRVDIIDYISMTTPTRSKFIFRQPKLSYVTNVFLLPFDILVWSSTFFLALITSLVLFLIVKWEWKKQTYIGEELRIIEINDSWTDSIFLTFGALCQQGAAHIPFSIPGRITTIFLFVSFMFLYTSFSANIVALLQSSSNNIQTLKDILHSRLEVGVDNTVFNLFYFPNATEPIRKAIYEEKVAPKGQNPHFMPIEEGISRMRQGLFAFHVETGPAYKLVSETFQEVEKCGLKEIQYLQVPDPWLATQKRTSYKKMLTIGLRLIQESGLQSREVGLIYTKKPQCLTRGNSFVSVGLVDCYPATVVLAGGLAAGIILLVAEIYVYQRLKCYKSRILRTRENNNRYLNAWT